jgi:hypothetical protein
MRSGPRVTMVALWCHISVGENLMKHLETILLRQFRNEKFAGKLLSKTKVAVSGCSTIGILLNAAIKRTDGKAYDLQQHFERRDCQ